ncbi:MAG: Beta-lactamase OXA-10 precursor [bacterium ADurb.Bin374]|nr:MAG: Beta-lactamase OXA-10 precursor [bacterium ADurb.Bin374]
MNVYQYLYYRSFGISLVAVLLFALVLPAHGQAPRPLPESGVQRLFAGKEGALVIIDCSSGAVRSYGTGVATEPLPPCSTFKIWNALIGHETGLLTDPDQGFYTWDGQTRAIASWNRDLTLREAFQVSCVPAFQALARTIGLERMQSWLRSIDYGDRDISAGIDCFWLPAKNRKTILITPTEQALLMQKLVSGALPFSPRAFSFLKELMRCRKTDRGTLYGKTGSGAFDKERYMLGWYVGFVETREGLFCFACAVKGEQVTGKDVRAIVEAFLEEQGYV